MATVLLQNSKVNSQSKFLKSLKGDGPYETSCGIEQDSGLVLGYMLADFDHRPIQERITIENYLDWFYVADSLTNLPTRTLGLLKKGTDVINFWFRIYISM